MRTIAQIEERPTRFGSLSEMSWDRRWDHVDNKPYVCRSLLCPELDGGFSVHALRLPGVASQGDTIEEALENIADAFRGAVQYYLNEEGAIPWADAGVERTKGSEERWILVNV